MPPTVRPRNASDGSRANASKIAHIRPYSTPT